MITLICIGIFVVVVIVIASIIGVAVSDSQDEEFEGDDYMGDSCSSSEDSTDYQDSTDTSGMSDYTEYSDYKDSTDYSEYFEVTEEYSDEELSDSSEQTGYFEASDYSEAMPYSDSSESSEESGFDIVFDDAGTDGDADVEIEFEEGEEQITCSDLSVVVGAIAEYNGSSLIDPTLMIYIYLLEEAINIGGFSTYFGDDLTTLMDCMASAQECSALGDNAGEDLATASFWSMWDSFTIDFNSVCPLSDMDY
jgi:hypothetical protein